MSCSDSSFSCSFAYRVRKKYTPVEFSTNTLNFTFYEIDNIFYVSSLSFLSATSPSFSLFEFPPIKGHDPIVVLSSGAKNFLSSRNCVFSDSVERYSDFYIISNNCNFSQIIFTKTLIQILFYDNVILHQDNTLLTFQRVSSAEGVKKVIQIFEKSFPPEEFWPEDKFNTVVSDPFLSSCSTFFMFLLKIGDSFVGAFNIVRFNSFDMLELFAISPTERNSGLGKSVLKLVKNFLKTDQSRPLCFELEKPSSITNSKQKSLAERRINFYNRNKFSLFKLPPEVTYLLPPLRDNSTFLKMQLMSFPGPLNYQTFAEIRKQLHLNLYNQEKIHVTQSEADLYNLNGEEYSIH
ncbi:hypothetical protein RCL1_004386 [Eukaryota sp. TZLM3-RCL]